MIEPSTGASWPEYFEVWVGLIVLIFTVGTALHLSGLNPATHRRLVQFLSEAGPQNWAQKTNSAFRRLFDYFYVGDQEQLDRWRFVWLGLLLTPILAVGTELNIFGWFLATGHSDKIVEEFQGCTAEGLVVLVTSAFAIAVAHSFLGKLRLSPGKRVVGSLVIGIPIVIGITFFAFWISDRCTPRTVLSVIDGTWWKSFLITAPGGVIAIWFMSKPRSFRIPMEIHPIRALASSGVFLFFVYVVSTWMLSPISIWSFFPDFGDYGYTLPGFLALNIFADAISLAETR